MPRALIVLFIGVFAAYTYYITVTQDCVEMCAQSHRMVLAHTSESPFRYRVLSAYLTQAFVFGESDRAIARAYAITHLIVLPIMLLLIYRWLRVWLAFPAAMIGVLVVSGLLPWMFRIWGIALYSALEIVFLCTGLLILRYRWRGWQTVYVLLIALATLNRETAILLPLAYLAVEAPRWRERRYWLYGGLFLAIWGVVYGGLRLTLGTAPDFMTIAETWAFNTGGGWTSNGALVKHLFFAPVWLLYLYYFRRAPGFLRRLSPVVMIYAGLVIVFAAWNEVRLLLPLLVLTLPVALRGAGEEQAVSEGAISA